LVSSIVDANEDASMTKPSPRAVAASSPLRIGLAVTLTVILSLALLLAPRIGHAADADVSGRWIADRNDPSMDYSLIAGSAPGSFVLTVPPKALGGKAGEVVTLQRVSAGKLESVKGSILRGTFTITGPRRAEFRAMENTKQSFHVIDQLLERP
jgi:hypothetical protein